MEWFYKKKKKDSECRLTFSKSKEDNVNTAILALYVHDLDHVGPYNLTSPIRYHAAYLDVSPRMQRMRNLKCQK